MHTYCQEEDFYEECYGCENKRKVIARSIEYLDELVRRLYLTDQTDIEKIEGALDKLCDCLGVKTINAQINIEEKKPDYLDMWIEQNTAYLKSLGSK